MKTKKEEDTDIVNNRLVFWRDKKDGALANRDEISVKIANTVIMELNEVKYEINRRDGK